MEKGELSSCSSGFEEGAEGAFDARPLQNIKLEQLADLKGHETTTRGEEKGADGGDELLAMVFFETLKDAVKELGETVTERLNLFAHSLVDTEDTKLLTGDLEIEGRA